MVLFELLKFSYYLSFYILCLGFWIFSSFVDRVHIRERSRRCGVVISGYISKVIKHESYQNRFKIYTIRPICVILDVIAGFFEGIENLEPIIKIENNQYNLSLTTISAIPEPIANVDDANANTSNVNDNVSNTSHVIDGNNVSRSSLTPIVPPTITLMPNIELVLDKQIESNNTKTQLNLSDLVNLPISLDSDTDIDNDDDIVLSDKNKNNNSSSDNIDDSKNNDSSTNSNDNSKNNDSNDNSTDETDKTDKTDSSTEHNDSNNDDSDNNSNDKSESLTRNNKTKNISMVKSNINDKPKATISVSSPPVNKIDKMEDMKEKFIKNLPKNRIMMSNNNKSANVKDKKNNNNSDNDDSSSTSSSKKTSDDTSDNTSDDDNSVSSEKERNVSSIRKKIPIKLARRKLKYTSNTNKNSSGNNMNKNNINSK